MTVFLPITIFIPFMCKFLHTVASEALPCDISNEALYINNPLTKDQNEIPVCPADFNTELDDMDEKLAQYSELQYCLFEETILKENKRLCNRDVKPLMYIVEDENNKPVRCGSTKNQVFHNFGYIYCQIMNDDQLRSLDSSKLKIIAGKIFVRYVLTYTVCYDISKTNTIWTRHQVLPIFKDPIFIDETYCPKKINDDPYYENSKTYFKILKDEFEKEKDEDTIFRMVPQQLVPAKHFALRVWKKTTNHYINTAPMWKILRPLMTAIDEGIQRASLNVYLHAFESKIPHNGLIIYTAVKPATSLMDRIWKWFSKEERLEPNIWYKFVYDPETQKGVMIHIHNTPLHKVNSKIKEKDFCNFETWTDDKKIRDTIVLQLLKYYAYCSKVTSREIRKLFYTDLIIKKEVLNIDILGRSITKSSEKNGSS